MTGYTLLNTNQLEGLPYRTELIRVDGCGNTIVQGGNPRVEYYCNVDKKEQTVVMLRSDHTYSVTHGVPMADGIFYLVNDEDLSEKLR